jgi:hypothetical protein
MITLSAAECSSGFGWNIAICDNNIAICDCCQEEKRDVFADFGSATEHVP